jgi:hypothetical protein
MDYLWGIAVFKFVISIAMLVYQGVPGIVNPGFLNCFKPPVIFWGGWMGLPFYHLFEGKMISML